MGILTLCGYNFDFDLFGRVGGGVKRLVLLLHWWCVIRRCAEGRKSEFNDSFQNLQSKTAFIFIQIMNQMRMDCSLLAHKKKKFLFTMVF